MRSCKKQILGCYIKMEFPIFGKSTNFNNRKIKYNIDKTFYERKDIDEKQIKADHQAVAVYLGNDTRRQARNKHLHKQRERAYCCRR